MIRVWFAFLAWAFVATGAGFMLGAAAGAAGHGASLYLYGFWLVGLAGFAVTAAYLLRRRSR